MIDKKTILMASLTIIAFIVALLLYSTSEGGERVIYEFQLEQYTKEYARSETVLNIYDECKEYNETEYLTCISNKIDFKKLYVIGEVTNPDNLFIDGGDCKTFTVYYNSLMDLKGIEYQTIQISNHVFSIADNVGNYTYCVLDQSLIECYK